MTSRIIEGNFALPRRYATSAVLFFVLLATWGAINRGKLAGFDLLPMFSFTALMHAHSHVAYFGWASLSIMGAIIAHLRDGFGLTAIPNERTISINLMLIVATTLAAWAGFTLQGYAPLSITVSSINVIWWYVFAWILLRAWQQRTRSPDLPMQYFLAATIFMVVSSVGAWTRAAMIGFQVSDALATDGAVYFYLHTFTEGWLVLGAMGIVYWLLPRLAGRPVLNERLARVQLGLTVILLLPTFLVELYADGLPEPWNYIGGIFQILMTIPNVLFVYNIVHALRIRRSQSLVSRFIEWSVLAFLVKAVFDVARAFEPVALALGGRQSVVGYLHLTLLGFVSLVLMAMVYELTGQTRDRRAGVWHLALVVAGMWGMILALFAAGGGPLVGIQGQGVFRFWMWLALGFAYVTAFAVYLFAW
ncbi:MAG TPA: cbb3-type cytochrome c oxidase subunit I, partial [Anaerolineae bacterium]